MASDDPPRILSAEDIWAAPDIQEFDVPVPQWGGSVRIRTFSMKQFHAMQKQATVKDRFGKESLDPERLEALLFCEGVIEPHIDVADYERLLEKSAVAIGQILKAISNASGLSEAAVTEADKSARDGFTPPLRILSGARIGGDDQG